MSQKDFEDYLENNKESIEKLLRKSKFETSEERKCFYKELKKLINLYNFGTVNLINAMFFLSKGAIPIYDYFAHVGVKALLLNKSPLEVFVANAPSKDSYPRGRTKIRKEYYLALNVLEEYMWMLQQVFPEEINNGSTMYISRDLDQALWVYGHSTKRWDNID